MQFRLLGPVEIAVVTGGASRIVPLSRPRSRAVLAWLLLAANRLVTMDSIVDALWGEAPPATARNQVQADVSAIRRALREVGDRDPIDTTATGYRLTVREAELDLAIFDGLLLAARTAADDGDLPAAARFTRQALELWRGPALGDISGAFVDAARVALEEQRLDAAERLAEAELQLGRHRELVAELTVLAGQHPLREGVVRQLALALHRSGRSAEALDVLRRLREALADEHGINPSAAAAALELSILRADPALHPPSGRAAAGPATVDGATARGPTGPGAQRPPAMLPVDVFGFTGRESELAQLDDLLAESDERLRTVVISAVSGTAGVGKTALAVHWAHRVADRFPDGQLYVNLRGFDPHGPAVTPSEAIRGFLGALGVSDTRMPVGLAAQVGMYRTLLAGRRVLVVLDNARSAEQVRPLLPGAPGCQVVVTSRDHLTSLAAAEGAHPLPLDLLPADEARELLVRRLGKTRVDAEPEAVDHIIARCERLPLALAIVAARAAVNAGFPLAALARELADAHSRLELLTGGDSATDLRALLSWSYEILSDPAARLFRLLGLHPGPDLATPAAASLAGVPSAEVRSPLDELCRSNLLLERAPGRFTFHDLLRAYARTQAHAHDGEADRRAALRRMFDHYLHTGYAAAVRLSPTRDRITLATAGSGVTVVEFADQDDVLAWYAVERPVLLAAVAQADDARFDTHAWQLAWTLWPYFNRRGHWQDWVTTHRVGLAAAERLGDVNAQAHAHHGLAYASGKLGDDEVAHDHYLRALDRYGTVGHRTGQARVHRGLGWVLERQGRYDEALDHVRQALELHREAGHQTGYAGALNALGWYHAHLGDYRRAIDYCEQSLALHRQLDDPHGEAAAWDSLGFAHHHLGDHREALACYRRSLRLYRSESDRYNEADVLTHVGDTYSAAGEPGAAREAWDRARVILDELDHPDADQVAARLDRFPS